MADDIRRYVLEVVVLTLAGLAALLQGTGIPTTYLAWPEDDRENPVPPLPYICYFETGADPTYADGQVFYSYDEVRIELYTAVSDPETERKVEEALKGFHWTKDKNYIRSERFFKIGYDVDV